MSYDDFDVDKARELREKAKDAFARQLRKEFLPTLFATAPVVVLICYAWMRWAETWAATEAPESGRFYLILYLFGLLFAFLLWGVYGLNARLLFVLKETRLLRLDFLTSRESPVEAATGGAESFSPNWPAMAVKTRALVLLMVGVFVLVPAGTFATYFAVDKYMRTHWAEYQTFGGQEVVDVHVTAEGRARAFSRVSITKCPSRVASMPIHIAQADATLESVTIGGRTVPFEPASDKERTYNIMPGLPENALKNALLEVVWSFPLADMVKNCGALQLQIQGTIPINSYAINAVIDDGAPYQFSGIAEGKKSCTLYWTKRPGGDYDARDLGSCGVGIIPVKQ